jgi:hypothetical protein
MIDQVDTILMDSTDIVNLEHCFCGLALSSPLIVIWLDKCTKHIVNLKPMSGRIAVGKLWYFMVYIQYTIHISAWHIVKQWNLNLIN